MTSQMQHSIKILKALDYEFGFSCLLSDHQKAEINHHLATPFGAGRSTNPLPTLQAQ